MRVWHGRAELWLGEGLFLLPPTAPPIPPSSMCQASPWFKKHEQERNWNSGEERRREEGWSDRQKEREHWWKRWGVWAVLLLQDMTELLQTSHSRSTDNSLSSHFKMFNHHIIMTEHWFILAFIFYHTSAFLYCFLRCCRPNHLLINGENSWQINC